MPSKTSPIQPMKNLPVKSRKISENYTTPSSVLDAQSQNDAIPLYTGSPIVVPKIALANAFIPMPAIYTSRLAELVIGKEELKRLAKERTLPKKDLLNGIIIDVKQELDMKMTPQTKNNTPNFSAACLLDDESFRKPFTLPKILDGKFYKNIQPNQKTPGAIQATCTTCFGLISGTTKSTGNFLSHIKRRHKELLPLCQLYCQAKNVPNNSLNGTSASSIEPCKLSQLNATNTVSSTTPATALKLAPTVTQLPTSYATATTHLAVPVTAVPMSIPIPLTIPTVQAPQMMTIMAPQHQTHGAVFISKDF